MSTETSSSSPPRKDHRWKFFRAGGVDQVMLRDASDIANLEHLDQKLWMALAMPTRGIEFDIRTVDLIDTDKDGRIRPPELKAAIRWAAMAFKDTGDLMKGGDSVPLSAIKDESILAGAKRILANLGKADATAISISDLADQAKIFANTKFNGDGVVPADSATDDATRKAIEDVITAMGAVLDRSGKPGVNQARLDDFFTQAAALTGWAAKAEADNSVAPVGADATATASVAIKAVKTKVDDYFARCRLAAFDPRAQAALNREEKEFLALAAKDLTVTAQEIAGLPLARVEANRALPLDGGLNPAWAGAVAAFAANAVAPLLGAGKATLTEAEWTTLQSKVAAYDAWVASKPPTAVDKLGLPRLRELLAGKTKEAIAELIRQDAALEKENAQITAVEKLVLFQRDLYELLTNYVNFADFYGRTGAVFQAGTLYLDARACNLCIEVTDAGKHAALASLAGAYLAYCDVSRPGGQKKSIVAVFTDGDSDNLMAGRNGIFYDRKGQDWDATITRIVSNPISIRESFWLPYKKLVRMIEEQVNKRAAAAEAASTDKLAQTATAVAAADQAKAPAKPAEPPKKLDLGTIALIGTAIGGVSALVGGFMQALFGLGIWMPLGVLGIILLISGPSMLLAYLKLRKRNLGPILDANGWAINTKAKMNVPFGAALTQVAKLPAGSERSLEDPFAEKKRPWKLYLTLIVVVVLGYLWWIGRLDNGLPDVIKRDRILKKGKWSEEQAAKPAAADAATTISTNSPPAK